MATDFDYSVGRSGTREWRAAHRQSAMFNVFCSPLCHTWPVLCYHSQPLFPVIPPGYLAGSPELRQLEAALQKHGSTVADVPIVIGDEEIRTDLVRYQPRPHDHRNPVAKFYHATPVSSVSVTIMYHVIPGWEWRYVNRRWC